MESEKTTGEREWSDEEEQWLLNYVNNIPITAEELVNFLRVVQSLPKGERNDEARMAVAVELHPDNPDKVRALMFRGAALHSLLKEEGVPFWTTPRADGTVLLTHDVVFATAAVQPLIEKNGTEGFDGNAFMQKALELADLDRID